MNNKDIILCISPEWMGGGCGVLRVQQNVNYINQNHQHLGAKVIMTPVPIFDANLLNVVRCVFVQRPFGPMPWLKEYKNFLNRFCLYRILYIKSLCPSFLSLMLRMLLFF